MELEVDAIDRLAVGYSVDYLEVGTADKVVLTPAANPPVVGANDNLVVTTYQSATSVDYSIPQSVVKGLADVAAIREDLLLKLRRLELAIVEAQQYRDLVEDEVRNQVFTEMSANYLSNAAMPEAIQAQILATDLSQMAIATGAGGTTASFQQIADRYVEVGEAVGGFTEQLNINTTNASNAVAATEVLTAKVDGVEATVTSSEYVAVGGFTQYTTGIPVTGQWRGSAGSYEQWRANSWVSITDAQYARYTKQLAIAGAKSLSTVGDAIVGWEYANGGAGDNEFKIKADKFYLEAAGSSTKQSAYVPFSVDATSGEISFNGKVTFSSVTGTPTHTSGTGEPTGTAVAGSTYTNTSTTPDTIYIYNDGWKVTGTPGAPGALTAADLSSTGTTVIDGGRITTGTIDAARINTDTLVTKHIKANANGLILDSEVTGSTTTPNIQGAYIKGGTIESVTLKTTYFAPGTVGIKTDSGVLCPLFIYKTRNATMGTTTLNSTTYSLVATLPTFYGYDNVNSDFTNRISTLAPTIIVSVSAVTGYVSPSSSSSKGVNNKSKIYYRVYDKYGTLRSSAYTSVIVNGGTYVITPTLVAPDDYVVIQSQTATNVNSSSDSTSSEPATFASVSCTGICYN